MEVDPPRSEHGSGTPPPEVDAEEVVEEDQLRSTAGQAGGLPLKKAFLVHYNLSAGLRNRVIDTGKWHQALTSKVLNMGKNQLVDLCALISSRFSS